MRFFVAAFFCCVVCCSPVVSDTTLCAVGEAELQIRSKLMRYLLVDFPNASEESVSINITQSDSYRRYLPNTRFVYFELNPKGSYVGRTLIKLRMYNDKSVVLGEGVLMVDATVRLPYIIATTYLSVGHVVTSADVHVEELSVQGQSTRAIHSLDQVLGKELKSTISKGATLTDWVLREVPTVRSGDVVTVLMKNQGVQLSVEGFVLEDGKIGDQVRVRLKYGRRGIYKGVITDAHTVRVDMR